MKNVIKWLPLVALIACIIGYAVNTCDFKDYVIGFVAFCLSVYYIVKAIE